MIQNGGQSGPFAAVATRRNSLHTVGFREIPICIAALSIFVSLLVVTKNPFAAAGVMLVAPMTILLCLNPVRLVYGIVVYSFVVRFLIDDLGIPSAANYVCDGLLMLALLFAVIKPREDYQATKSARCVAIFVLLFWLVATSSAILNGIELVLYFWAFRNTFRLFGFLYCCVRLLSSHDVENLMKFFLAFFWVNVLVCSFQYFALGTGQDNTNGLFGSGSGGNAMINILMFSVTAYHLFGYNVGKIRLWQVISVAAACCYISAIAEIKVFYVELPLLIGLVALLQKPSFKTVLLIALVLLFLVAGIQVLTAFNPYFTNYFTLDNIIESSSKGGYSNADNLNRLTAVSTLDRMFMRTSRDHMLGLGFGAGQYSQFFESSLYSVYGEILNWSWFTDAVVFLETGWLGLSLYVAILGAVAFGTFRKRRAFNAGPAVLRMSLSVVLLSLLLIVYNCTLTTDPGCYFIAVLFSFPYIYGPSGCCGDTNDCARCTRTEPRNPRLSLAEATAQANRTLPCTKNIAPCICRGNDRSRTKREGGV